MDLNMLIERRAPFIPVSRLFNRMVKDLDLEIIAGYQGLERPIFSTDVNRPGLALTGYLDYFANDRVQILGNTEIHFMERLTPSELSARLSQIFSFEVPVFVLSRRLTPQPIFMDWCNRNGVPVMRSALSTVEVISRIILFLNEEFAPETDIHGTAIDVYGVGCLLIGPPGIGKSEAALELVERGHRLVADDQVTLKCRRADYLYASVHPRIRHHMEIRGLGIIDIQSIYGVGRVRDFKRIGLLVQLEMWDEKAHYDRTGLDEAYTEILGVKLPTIRVPVRPGRNVAIIIEVAALNQRLKEMGIHSARRLNNLIMGTDPHL
ncbi:MAG TPA: HPr(Ser) kinase/phosphatase [Candidatus Hydrogenedentes bacterium]|nr:HPr(Ser) kinase/phosphatase [Candidatus Hydrogenedentota bacterium]